MNTEILRDQSFPVPNVPLDYAELYPSRIDPTHGILYEEPEGDKFGVLMTQYWHGGNNNNPPFWYAQFHKINVTVDQLAGMGLRNFLADAGIHTRIVEAPARADQPASTISAITLPTISSFCDMANTNLRSIVTAKTAQLVTDENPYGGNTTEERAENFKDRKLAIATRGWDPFGQDLLFGFHDRVQHGVAWYIMGLVPAIIEDIRTQAAGSLARTRATGDREPLDEFSGRTDDAIRTGVVAGVLADEPPVAWDELFSALLRPTEAAASLQTEVGKLVSQPAQ